MGIEELEISDQSNVENEPTAPELHIETVLETNESPEMLTLAQGLEFLKKRQDLIAHTEVNACKSQSYGSFPKQPQTKEVIDCWSSLERAANIFGTKYFEIAHKFNETFLESHYVSYNQQELVFARLLEEYRDAINLLYRKKGETLTSMSQCESSQASVWNIKTSERSSQARCGDNRLLELQVQYQVATWNKEAALKVKRGWEQYLVDLWKDYCVKCHNYLVVKYQLEDCMHEELTDASILRTALSLLFTYMNTSSLMLREDLTSWSYLLCERLLRCGEHFSSYVFIVNYLVRQVHSIEWALPLIQLQVDNLEDVQKVVALLSLILNHTKLDQNVEGGMEQRGSRRGNNGSGRFSLSRLAAGLRRRQEESRV